MMPVLIATASVAFFLGMATAFYIVGRGHRSTDEFRQANARLIAAAPDGLALAQMVVKYFGEDEIQDFLDGDITLRDAARALIAKAGGRA